MGVHMGRTISLKLTDKEERIVSQLNRQGISNSELLRDALWQYFEAGNSLSHHTVELRQTPIQTDVPTTEPVVQDYIKHLKDEIQQLRDQNQKFQTQIGEEFSRLHGQLFRISRTNDPSRLILPNRRTPEPPTPQFHQTHQVIDEFLKKRDEKKEF